MDQATGSVGLLAGMSLVQKALVGVSCAVMACGVGLGVTGALQGEDGSGQGQARQADRAAADASGSADAGTGRVGGPEDGVSSLTGDGGWPLPLPTPSGGPGGPPEPAGTPEGDGPEPADGGGGAASAEGGGSDPWSPAIFRMGFSFFVGFAVAYAVRAFVKVSLIGLGLMFLFLFGLQYAGFIEVRWDVVGDRYESSSAWLAGQVRSFQDFATGYLPSGGAALAGLALGIKRK